MRKGTSTVLHVSRAKMVRFSLLIYARTAVASPDLRPDVPVREVMKRQSMGSLWTRMILVAQSEDDRIAKGPVVPLRPKQYRVVRGRRNRSSLTSFDKKATWPFLWGLMRAHRLICFKRSRASTVTYQPFWSVASYNNGARQSHTSTATVPTGPAWGHKSVWLCMEFTALLSMAT